jgi:hypothetical protein
MIISTKTAKIPLLRVMTKKGGFLLHFPALQLLLKSFRSLTETLYRPVFLWLLRTVRIPALTNVAFLFSVDIIRFFLQINRLLCRKLSIVCDERKSTIRDAGK